MMLERGFYKDNMKKENIDLKDNKLLWKLTIPIFMEMFFAVIVSNVDQLMMSSVSQEAVAAVGNGAQLGWVLTLFFNVVATASTILITQYKGANDEKSVSLIYPLAIVVNIILGLLLSLVCIFAIRPIFTLLHVEAGQTFEYAVIYMKIVGGTIISQAMLNCFFALLRANTYVKEAMFVSVLINILNIFGNALTLYVFKMGVTGVAISTAVSRLIGMTIIICIFHYRIGKVNFSLLKGREPLLLLKKMVGIGLPSAGENISYDVSQLVVTGFVNTLGLASVNAKIYVCIVVQFAYIFTLAISEGTQILEGYLIGAGEKEEAENRVVKTTITAVIASEILTLIIFLFSDQIIGLFPSADETVLYIAKRMFFIELFLEIGRAINIVMVRCLQGAGDVKFPVIMSVIFTWCLSVTLGYILGILLPFGIYGIWVAMALDENIRCTVLFIHFKKGKWKKIDLLSAKG